MNSIKNFINDETGVTAIEYALLAALMAAVVVAGAATMGGAIKEAFDKVAAAVSPKP